MIQNRGDSPTILITGAGGQVGAELRRSMALLGRVVALTRAECDLASPDQIASTIRTVKPDVIVNAGGYTAVDNAETNAELAHAVNAVGPGVLAEEARLISALLVQYSTDYVFDGSNSQLYTELDVPNPISVYGESKLAGEKSVINTAGKYYIFRTSWIYGLSGKNFVKSIVRAAQTRDELSVVSDQFGAPTAAALVADVTAHAVRGFLRRDDPVPSGVYHLAASGATNWFDYARFIVDFLVQAEVPVQATSDRIASVTSAEYPQAARRPANSRLNTARLREALGIELPDWRDGVQALLTQLVEAKGALR